MVYEEAVQIYDWEKAISKIKEFGLGSNYTIFYVVMALAEKLGLPTIETPAKGMKEVT